MILCSSKAGLVADSGGLVVFVRLFFKKNLVYSDNSGIIYFAKERCPGLNNLASVYV